MKHRWDGSRQIDWRRRVVRAGSILFLLDSAFYLAWHHVPNMRPCAGRAIGVEAGLAGCAVAALLSLFGNGWKRVAYFALSVVLLYFWISWITWIGQMEC
jgi:hypothetical protein